MKYICLLLTCALPAWATNYTVKAGGGGSFTTMAACATQMSTNGTGVADTCTVYAGTYAENVTIPAGSSGNLKTFTVNPGDLVYVLSFTLNSYTVVNGFQIQNPSSPNSTVCVSVASNATTFTVSNNVITECGNGYMIKEPASSTTTYGRYTGNTISYGCSTSGSPNVCTAMQLVGNYHLLDSNTISHVSDGPYMYGLYNVMRNNTFGPTTDNDCGSNSGNCHIDFMQADANTSTPGSQYNLFEGNTVQNMTVTGSFVGSGAHAGPLFQAESCNGVCNNAIVRFHTAMHIAGGGITDDNSGTNPVAPNSPAWINVKAYNNDWIDVLTNITSGTGAEVNAHSHASTGGSNVNEIYYIVSAASCNQTNAYDYQDTSGTGATYGYSIGYCANGGTLYGHTYGSGAFTADTGNLSSNPSFNNYGSNDFRLAAGSPALNAGTSLTTVAAGDTGTGTSLIVNDAGFFQAIAGITGVQADCISVGTVGNHVCISSINYSTNTLTLAGSITRSNAQAVWLYSDSSGTVRLTGSAPNMGSMGAAPTGSSWSGGVQLPQAIQ